MGGRKEGRKDEEERPMHLLLNMGGGRREEDAEKNLFMMQHPEERFYFKIALKNFPFYGKASVLCVFTQKSSVV